jgi:NAD(P)-dependent dehydrogenase (short-subunit alcohol dehydrogenase family)
MRLSFDGEVVIVTGAGAGLGRAYARELARRGARIVVNDLGGGTDGRGSGSEAADRVVEEIAADGGEAVASFDSVATTDGGAAIVRRALDSFGRLDAVISNAGILRDRSFLKLEREDLQSVMDVHLMSAFNIGQPAFAAMKEGGRGGRFVFTTSGAGLFGNFGQANYSAAKMGLVGLTRTLAIEGARSGIKANAVAPVAATRLLAGVETEEDTPLAPRNVAPMAVLLAHRDCPSTGEIVFTTGGWYSRVVLGLTQGWVAGEGENSPEGIAAHWDEIRDAEGFVEPPDAMATSTMMQAKLNLKLG